ncbi:MAG: hypothetical protein DME57_06400, partial [Verrucomicrobia bacterium]
MGRRHTNFVKLAAALAVSLFIAGFANAQPGGNGRRMPPPQQHRAPDLRNRYMAMPPEDRQTFRRNAERWMQMGPEERSLMRQREQVYRAQVQREVDPALRDTGLRLEGEKRAQFEQRYLQERRRIEHSLRQEIESKRQQQLPALQERLKREFQDPSSVGGSTS